jgi:hypothetical protein
MNTNNEMDRLPYVQDRAMRSGLLPTETEEV